MIWFFFFVGSYPDFNTLEYLGISWDWYFQLTLLVTEGPHLIYCNLTQNRPYSIPHWVNDLASSFVLAVFQTSKSSDFSIPMYLEISWDWDIQSMSLETAWPHIIYINLKTINYVVSGGLLLAMLQTSVVEYPGTGISSWHCWWQLDHI